MKSYTETRVEAILDQAVSSTETMNSLDIDPDVIKARLKLLRELADGFGVNVEIPSNRKIMVKRFFAETGVEL